MGGTGPVACHATDHQGEPPSPKYGDLRRSVTGPDVRWHRACGGYLIGPAARPFWHPSGEAAGTAGRPGRPRPTPEVGTGPWRGPPDAREDGQARPARPGRPGMLRKLH